MSGTVPSILFVCLGNICRSPTAEGIAEVRSEQMGLAVKLDSAGTGEWHIGHPPDPRAIAEAARHDTPIQHLRARQVQPEDFTRFDHIVAMDHENLANLKRLQPAGGTTKLSLLLDHVPGREGQAVADPYYGDEKDFELCWQDCDAGVRGLLASLQASG